MDMPIGDGPNSRTIIADDSTTQRVRKIIIEQLGVGPEDVRPEVLLVPEHDGNGRRIEGSQLADLGCDSLDVVELTMAFEEEFRIEIADDESATLNTGTVQMAIDLIDSKRAQAST